MSLYTAHFIFIEVIQGMTVACFIDRSKFSDLPNWKFVHLFFKAAARISLRYSGRIIENEVSKIMAEAIVPNSSIITQLISQSDSYYERTLFTRVSRLPARTTSFSDDRIFTNISINTADFGVYQIRSLRALGQLYATSKSDPISDFAVGSPSTSNAVSNIPTAVGSSITVNLYNYTAIGLSNPDVSFDICIGIKITKLENSIKIEPICSRYRCIGNYSDSSQYYDFRTYITVAFL